MCDLMKALLFVTGRGIGGDAVTAYNISQALIRKGVECEFVLDHTAPGLLFEKKGIKWHQSSIPQAGGHAATKSKLFKASIKTLNASLEAARLCRQIHPNVVVGVIGGGAIVGCIAAIMARIPAVGILITPMDAKVCTKIATTIVLPESNLFTRKMNDKKIYKAYSPVDPKIVEGNPARAMKKIPLGYDANKPTILISSGSTLFEDMARAASRLGEEGIDANLMVVGEPLEQGYKKHFSYPNVFYLGYIDWIRDLYQLVDLAILTDDGMMIHEAMVFQLPVVALLGVKYGRYHNLAEVFEGAVLESNLQDLPAVVKKAFKELEDMKKKTEHYGKDILAAADNIADAIIRTAKKE